MVRRGGFTLLELLVVVIVVAILAGIALPNFTKAIEKAKVQEAQGVLNTLFQAERIYRLDHDTFTTLALLDANGYLTNPNPNANWNFSTSGETSTAFLAAATRTSGAHLNNTVEVDQNFTGSANPNYGGKIYRGNHPLRN